MSDPLRLTPSVQSTEAPSALVNRARELDPLYRAAEVTLRLGFRGGAILLALGVALAVIRQEPLEHTVKPFIEVLPAALSGEVTGIIDLAILWIVATPVVTVLVVAIGFLRIGDRRFVLLSLLALAVLGISITLALTK